MFRSNTTHCETHFVWEDEAHNRELTFRVTATAYPAEPQTHDCPGSGPSLDDLRVSLEWLTTYDPETGKPTGSICGLGALNRTEIEAAFEDRLERDDVLREQVERELFANADAHNEPDDDQWERHREVGLETAGYPLPEHPEAA